MDFFEVTVEVDGVRVKVWKFLIRLMYSGRDFARLYERCDQLSFLNGHVRAFEYFGGVPQRSIYDSLSAAVARVTFPRRQLSPNPPMRSGLGVGTRGEGRGTRRSALDSDKWGRWRPLVVVGGADGGPGQRRWGGVGGTACRGRRSRTGPVRLCGSVG